MKQNLELHMDMGMDMVMDTVTEATQGMVTMSKRKEKLSLKSGIILAKRNVANNTSA